LEVRVRLDLVEERLDVEEERENAPLTSATRRTPRARNPGPGHKTVTSANEQRPRVQHNVCRRRFWRRCCHVTFLLSWFEHGPFDYRFGVGTSSQEWKPSPVGLPTSGWSTVTRTPVRSARWQGSAPRRVPLGASLG
jgi:hypothetical protein